MSEPADHDPGQTYIWTIACILFISVVTGGGCLLAYIAIPEYQSSDMFPILGFVLVCMPWIFWIVTVIYRLLSRALGFRMAFGSLHGGDTSTKVSGTGHGKGGAPKSVDDSDDAEIIDVNVDGEGKDISSKSRESEKALAS